MEIDLRSAMVTRDNQLLPQEDDVLPVLSLGIFNMERHETARVNTKKMFLMIDILTKHHGKMLKI